MTAQKLTVSLGAVILILGLAWGLNFRLQEVYASRKEKQPSRPPITVEVSEVKTEAIQETRQLSGSALPFAQFTLSSRVSGRLLSLRGQMGEVIQRGAILGQIEDTLLQQEIEQLKAARQVDMASIQEIQVGFERAEGDLNRVVALYQKKLASQEELDKANSELESSRARLVTAQARIQQNQASIRQAQIKREEAKIQALWNGGASQAVVSQRFVDPGTTLALNTPLLSLIDLHLIRARAPLTEKDYARIQLGQTARIQTDAFPGEVFIGKVARLAPLLSEESRTAELELEIPNPNFRLKPGMFLKIELLLATHPSAQVIPLSALVRKAQDSLGVFVLNTQGQVDYFSVKTGIVQANRVEILEPKLKGRVVTLGHQLLKPGAKVRLANPNLRQGKNQNKMPENKATKHKAK
ncbi:hypothetical protein COW36_18845 [bacterium (Candidatus Blackallbacteria) CG17_big_fil_post_rev_8_21_14_2_50_48_46]|uniref:CusB-like beta-barrel domain-containing protein n=1 Tax=bacterium (Candidatus Blackallbacteria) CG17_big_fil_post_rev_8_21_14_2_50_48_46 TaxID=2014261 RepID=A0A2M7G0J9_9BACT|nr:MAG: hypothetical protein COW64_25625 [bacterium (Candidatus Blackallbacteria) CG18_big_fil_WC_8_21_14_2_50_49_26]PIW14985.1 MAG: hypothetical protein COW36_18845 [bacterium (Candidatus Blackallbacteria) CG17_big_fil_post_rev_8_21_14_2_50_48_46]PIW50066.1 MAG: hypothetical protein COW20_03780 [bacterium (Candidatus Blackallbacteria) CG13_big_fil_rev_8_21_14_2_50_49_14]